MRYSGQEWTCACCHQLKSVCPGCAVARNCTADRILLSAHMREHWEAIGYHPETSDLNGVDETDEPEVQVGDLIFEFLDDLRLEIRDFR